MQHPISKRETKPPQIIFENAEGIKKMAAISLEQKALKLLATFEKAGKSVRRVTIEGRRIELELSSGDERDEFDRIDMRHDKT